MHANMKLVLTHFMKVFTSSNLGGKQCPFSSHLILPSSVTDKYALLASTIDLRAGSMPIEYIEYVRQAVVCTI